MAVHVSAAPGFIWGRMYPEVGFLDLVVVLFSFLRTRHKVAHRAALTYTPASSANAPYLLTMTCHFPFSVTATLTGVQRGLWSALRFPYGCCC